MNPESNTLLQLCCKMENFKICVMCVCSQLVLSCNNSNVIFVYMYLVFFQLMPVKCRALSYPGAHFSLSCSWPQIMQLHVLIMLMRKTLPSQQFISRQTVYVCPPPRLCAHAWMLLHLGLTNLLIIRLSYYEIEYKSPVPSHGYAGRGIELLTLNFII